MAGCAHQRGFELVMRQDRAAAQGRKIAMLEKRADAHQRIVPPEGTAIGGPPGGAGRIGAHARAHAELEQSREGGAGRRADDERLQNADLRVGLCDAGQLQDGVSAHVAVGVEHDHRLVGVRAACAEFADIAGLEAGIVDATPIMHTSRRVRPRGTPIGDLALLGRSYRFVRRVGQEMIGKMLRVGGCRQFRLHAYEASDGAGSVFVAYGHDQRIVPREWRGDLACRDERRRAVEPMPREPQEPEPQRGVDEAQDRPGRGDQKTDKENYVDETPTPDRQDALEPDRKAAIDREIEREHDPAAARDPGLRLQAGGRRGCFDCRHGRMSHTGFLQQIIAIRKRREGPDDVASGGSAAEESRGRANGAGAVACFARPR